MKLYEWANNIISSITFSVKLATEINVTYDKYAKLTLIGLYISLMHRYIDGIDRLMKLWHVYFSWRENNIISS